MLIFSPLLAVFVYLAAIHDLRIRRVWKLLVFLVLLCISAKYFILHLFGGPVFFAPDLPRGVMLFSAWIYAVFLSWFALLLAGSILRGISRLILFLRKKQTPQWWKKGTGIMNFSFLALALLCSTLGIFWGTEIPDVNECTIFLKDLPEKAEGMRIALLADPHIDYISREEDIREIVRKTNALDPDLTVIVGDFVDGTIERCGDRVRILSGLKARYGLYGVPGNHEYYSGYRPWTDFLDKNGITMLLNRSVKLPNGVFLGGVTDPAAKRAGEEPPDPAKAAKGISGGDCAILLSHQPIIAFSAKKYFDLQLSGHTHGGMVFGLHLIVKAFCGGFVSGHYRVGDMQMIVSNGTGIWSGFPIRFGKFSEIILITLKRQPE